MPINQDLLEQLRKKKEIARLGGGAEKIAKRHEKGLLTARERLVRLYTPETFQEFGLHAQHDTRYFGMEAKDLPGDGVVTGVGFLIHIYSLGYMAHDKGSPRFFTYLNLFIFAMSLLILGSSFVLLFVGWEGVGAMSYLLIGFWYDKDLLNGTPEFLVSVRVPVKVRGE